MLNIINYSKLLLITMLKDIDSDCIKTSDSIEFFNNSSIWNDSFDLTTCTFIDLIKGIISSHLTTFIQNITNLTPLTEGIVFTFMRFIFDQTQKQIWLPCYNNILEIE